MSHSRRRTLGAVAVVVAAALVPSTATATPNGSLSGLLLKGEDTCGFKTVYGAPQTPYLFGPVQLLGEDLTPTGTWLFPYGGHGRQRRGAEGASPGARRDLHPAWRAADEPGDL